MSKFDVLQNMTIEEAFSKIAELRLWSSGESISGTGSELEKTIELRKELVQIFNRLNITSLVDCGCGDLNWLKEIIDKLEIYIGLDVMDESLDRAKKYETDNVIFKYANIVEELPIPKHHFDAILYRDVFVHLKFNDIHNALDVLKGKDIKYIITTTFPNISVNEDLDFTGKWRKLNMSIPPFDFGDPLYLLNDEKTKDKFLGVWEL